MDTFRNDVKALIKTSSKPPASSSSTSKKTLYRVRKSWADNKSQIGAFKILKNAKRKADSHKGYSVFDESGKKIYPEESTNTYAVKDGDTLWSITQEILGDGSRYPEIKSMNGLENDLIQVGQILKVPARNTSLKVGDKVTITAKNYATGELIPSWVKKQTHEISEISDGKVLLGYPDGISSWVSADEIKKA